MLRRDSVQGDASPPEVQSLQSEIESQARREMQCSAGIPSKGMHRHPKCKVCRARSKARQGERCNAPQGFRPRGCIATRSAKFAERDRKPGKARDAMLRRDSVQGDASPPEVQSL